MAAVPPVRPRILYISYNGLGTALVRSQVLPYLRALRDVADFDLLTFEQDAPERPTDQEVAGLGLHALRYHKRPMLAAKAIDLVTGVIAALWLTLRRDVRMIHARSHVAAAIAAVAAALTGRPFIFDMRGFLGDERVEAGSMGKGGLLHRAIGAIERLLIARAAAVVVLTERARQLLLVDERYKKATRNKPVVAIPCCVDVSRYPRVAEHDPDRLVYVGSVGTWYRLDAMIGFFEHYRALRPNATLVIANQGQHDLIRREVEASPARDAVTIVALRFDEVPELLESCAAGLVLLREGGSKIGSSPIKVAEYLAAGLPVVANAIAGDVPEILRAHRVGVVVERLDGSELRAAANELVVLLQERERLRARARDVAETTFSLGGGAAQYRALYHQVLAKVGGE